MARINDKIELTATALRNWYERYIAEARAHGHAFESPTIKTLDQLWGEYNFRLKRGQLIRDKEAAAFYTYATDRQGTRVLNRTLKLLIPD